MGKDKDVRHSSEGNKRKMKKERPSKRKRDQFDDRDGGEELTRTGTRAHKDHEGEVNEEAELTIVKRATKKLRSEKKVQTDIKDDDDTRLRGPSADGVSVRPGRERSSRKKRRKEAETTDETLRLVEDDPRADDHDEPQPVGSSRTRKEKRIEREMPKEELRQEAEVVVDGDAAIPNNTAVSKKQRFIVFVGVCPQSRNSGGPYSTGLQYIYIHLHSC